MKEETQCDLCGNPIVQERSDEELVSDLQAIWPGVAREQIKVLCSECNLSYPAIHHYKKVSN